MIALNAFLAATVKHQEFVMREPYFSPSEQIATDSTS